MKYLMVTLILFCTQVGFAQGNNLVVTCQACHGAQGISTSSLWPNLAGQKKDYLVLQLKAFRSGARNNPIMNPMSQNLSDSDIDKIAEYFSGLK